MSVKTIPTKFRTGDGAEFDNEAEATKHQALLDAIEEVNFFPYHCEYDVNNGLNFKYEQKGKWETYTVGELYAEQSNAQKALLAVQREWLKRQTEQVEALASAVEPRAESEAA